MNFRFFLPAACNDDYVKNTESYTSTNSIAKTSVKNGPLRKDLHQEGWQDPAKRHR